MSSEAPRASEIPGEKKQHVTFALQGAAGPRKPCRNKHFAQAQSMCHCKFSSQCPRSAPCASHVPSCLTAPLPLSSWSRQGWVILGMLWGKPLPPAHFLETNKKINLRNVATHLLLPLLGGCCAATSPHHTGSSGECPAAARSGTLLPMPPSDQIHLLPCLLCTYKAE